MLEIGSFSRNGLFQITDTRKDNVSGELYVTVREMVGDHCLDMKRGAMIKAMRELAKKAADNPTSTRLVYSWYGQNSDHATFAIV